MRNFLDEYIQSVGSETRQKVSFILSQAKVDKEQLNSLANKISSSSQFGNLVLANESPNSLIKSGSMIASFSAIHTQLEELYRASNDIAILTESHAAVLSSDIKALESELDALEKAIRNYAFLLSDTRSYDYSYLEPFNDDRGREYLDFPITDRSGASFTSLEEAFINGGDGTLSVSQSATGSWPMTGRVLQINADSYTTSNTGIDKTLNSNVGIGWRTSISSPAPITSGISDPDFQGYSKSGLQCVIEYTLESPAPSDTITLDPLSDSAIEVMQIRVYRDAEEEEYFDLMDISRESENASNLKKTKTYRFPLQSVAKFKVFLRSNEYKRVGATPLNSEEAYKSLSNLVSETNSASPYDTNSSMAQRDSIHARNNKVFKDDSFKSPHTIKMPEFKNTKSEIGALRKSAHILERGLHTNAQGSTWSNSGPATTALMKVLNTIMGTEGIQEAHNTPQRQGKNNARDNSNALKDGLYSNATLMPTPDSGVTSANNNFMTYGYTIGLNDVKITASVNNFRSVFVSKNLPSPGDCGEVKIKAQHFNYMATGTTRDNDILTSVEYSVTNIGRPVKESDWIPILPSGDTEISSERFFPDNAGKGLFRFPASRQNDIKLYKNGYLFTILPISELTIESQSKQSIIGLTLPKHSFGAVDVLTVTYTPSSDATVVNFSDQEGIQFSNPPLVSAYDENGAGEWYIGTNGQLSISLLNKPFIDYVRARESDYIESYGISGAYNPIVVRFDDGTLAYNLTNYSGGDQYSLDPSFDSYQFIANGKDLLFNKPVSKSFRVFYQYLPSNVRVRIVLRVNDTNFVSPEVDYYQFKAKTRKSDILKDA